LRNIEAPTEAGGGTLNDVVALRVYVVNYQPGAQRQWAAH
jgi:hypothetical protein